MSTFAKALKEALEQESKPAPAEKVKRRKPATTEVYPEPGEWVYARPKGMKPISRPEPLPEGKIDNDEVRHHVRHDGLGHCIFSLIPHDKIKDDLLKELWRIARKGVQKVLEHLEDHQ